MSTEVAKKKVTSLFESDDDDDGDILSSITAISPSPNVSSPMKETITKKTETPPQQSTSIEAITAKTASLEKQPTVPKQPQKKSMLDSSSDEDDDESSNNLFKTPMIKHNPLITKLDETISKSNKSPVLETSKTAVKTSLLLSDDREVTSKSSAKQTEFSKPKSSQNTASEERKQSKILEMDSSDDDLFSLAKNKAPSTELKVVPDFTDDNKLEAEPTSQTTSGICIAYVF